LEYLGRKMVCICFLLNGLCLHPNKSFTKNIGFDGSKKKCDKNSLFDSQVNHLNNAKFRPSNYFRQNRNAYNKIVKYNTASKKNDLILKILCKIKNISHEIKFN
jgi:hypothetical protein